MSVTRIADNATMIVRVAVARRFPRATPRAEPSASSSDPRSSKRSMLKKNGRSSVGAVISMCWLADRRLAVEDASCGVRAARISDRSGDAIGDCGLAATEKPSRSAVAASVASPSALNGARETISVARFVVVAENTCSRGFATPSSNRVATARLIKRPISRISLGAYQRETVKTPVGAK